MKCIYGETPNKGTTMFDGQEANSSTISLTITENGAPIATEIDAGKFLINWCARRDYSRCALTPLGVVLRAINLAEDGQVVELPASWFVVAVMIL